MRRSHLHPPRMVERGPMRQPRPRARRRRLLRVRSVSAAAWPERDYGGPFARQSSSALGVRRRHRDWRPAVLLLLELSVFMRPQTLEVLDHLANLLIAQLVRLKRRHGQLGCLVELIAQPTA